MTCPDAFDEMFPEIGLQDAHVRVKKLIEMGCDLMLAGGPPPFIVPCGACEADRHGLPPSETFLHTDHNGSRWYHNVICASCGTSGAWGRTESQALARWATIWRRETRPA